MFFLGAKLILYNCIRTYNIALPRKVGIFLTEGAYTFPLEVILCCKKAVINLLLAVNRALFPFTPIYGYTILTPLPTRLL